MSRRPVMVIWFGLNIDDVPDGMSMEEVQGIIEDLTKRATKKVGGWDDHFMVMDSEMCSIWHEDTGRRIGWGISGCSEDEERRGEVVREALSQLGVKDVERILEGMSCHTILDCY